MNRSIPPGPRKQPSVSPPGQVQGHPQIRAQVSFTGRGPTPPVNIRPQAPEAFEGPQLQYQRHPSHPPRFSQSPSNFPQLGTSPHQPQVPQNHQQPQSQPPQQLQIQSVRQPVAVLSPDSNHFHQVYFQPTGNPQVSNTQLTASPSNPQTVQIQGAQPVVFAGQGQANFAAPQGQAAVYSSPHPSNQAQGQQGAPAQQSFPSQQPRFQQPPQALHPRQRPPTPQQVEVSVNLNHPTSQAPQQQPQVFISQSYPQASGPHDLSKASLVSTVPPRGQTPPQSAALAPGIMQQYSQNAQQANPRQSFVPRSMPGQNMAGQRPTRPVIGTNSQVFQQQYPQVMLQNAQLGQQFIIQQSPNLVQYQSGNRMPQAYGQQQQQAQVYPNYYAQPSQGYVAQQPQMWQTQPSVRMPANQTPSTAAQQNNYPTAKREKKKIQITDPNTGLDVNLDEITGGQSKPSGGTPPQSSTPNSRGTPVSQQSGEGTAQNENANIVRAEFATQVAATLRTDKSATPGQNAPTPPQQQVPPGAPPQQQMVPAHQGQAPMTGQPSMPVQPQMTPQGMPPRMVQPNMVPPQKGQTAPGMPQQQQPTPQVIHQHPNVIVQPIPGGPTMPMNRPQQIPMQAQQMVQQQQMGQQQQMVQPQQQLQQQQMAQQPMVPPQQPIVQPQQQQQMSQQVHQQQPMAQQQAQAQVQMSQGQQMQKAAATQPPVPQDAQQQGSQQQMAKPTAGPAQEAPRVPSAQGAPQLRDSPQTQKGQTPVPVQEPAVQPQTEEPVLAKPEPKAVPSSVSEPTSEAPTSSGATPEPAPAKADQSEATSVTSNQSTATSEVPQPVQRETSPAQVPQPAQKEPSPTPEAAAPIQEATASEETPKASVEVSVAPSQSAEDAEPSTQTPLPQREDPRDRRKKGPKNRSRDFNAKGEGSEMDAFNDSKEGASSPVEVQDGATAPPNKESTPDRTAEQTPETTAASEKSRSATPQDRPQVPASQDKTTTAQPDKASTPTGPEKLSAVGPSETPESSASQEEQRRVAERNEKNSKEHSKVDESKEPSSQNNDNHVVDSKIDKSEVPVIKDKMELKYKYKEDQWSPLNPEGKKLYDRSFLLQLQYSSESMAKPYGLPQLPDVVLDTPIPSRNEKQFGQSQFSNSKLDFTPAYVVGPNSGGKPPPHKSSSRQKSGRGGGSSQGDHRKVITLHIQEDVKLHHTENAWQATVKKDVKGVEPVETDEDQELFRKVRSILNKLTPQKFQKLLQQVIDLGIDTEDKLAGTIDITFEKAISEPNFSVAYANLCKCLSNLKVQQKSNPEQFVMFRKLLLNRCQKEFERDKADALDLEEMQRAIDEAPAEKKKELTAEKDLAEMKARKRSLGNIRFIGELFKLRMLTEGIMHDCLLKLLRAQDDDSLEALCNLLKTIGKDLDEKSKQRVDQYFSQLQKLVDSKKHSSRLRFMMLDAIDLRKNDWVPRREDNAPKTIEQIHKEAHQEEQQKKQQLQNMPAHDHKGKGRGGRGSQSGSRGQQGEDGWTPVKPAKTPSIDPSRMKITKNTLDENSISLGRPGSFGAWGRGSSGGSKQAAAKEERPAAPGNRYSLLSGGGGGTGEVAESTRHPVGRGGGGTMYPSGREGKGGRLSQGRDRPPLASRPSQEQEREAALQLARNIGTPRSTSGSRASGGSRNQSRDSSRNRSRDNSRGRVPSGDRAADKRPSKSQKELPIEEIEKKSKALMDEYLHIHDLKEALQCLSELESPQTIHRSVEIILTHVLERSEKARQMGSHLLHEAIKQKVISPDNYSQGMRLVLEFADDMAIDIPQIWKYLGELMGPMIEDGVWHISNLKNVCDVLLPFNKAGVLVSHVLHNAARRLGHIKVGELWRAAHMSWSDFLPPGDNLQDFLAREKLDFTVGEEAPRSPEASTMPIDIIQKGLEGLITEQEAVNEVVFDWINANVSESRTKDPQFIRALMSVVCQSAIIGQIGSCKVDAERIKKRCILLQRYLDHDAKLELQALYALQALVHKLEHPPEVLRVFFDTLYDEDIISEDAFYQWDSSKDPAEQAGKGVAVASVVQFFTWLREAEEDDPEASSK